MTAPAVPVAVLGLSEVRSAEQWTAQEAAHTERVGTLVRDHLDRQSRGVKHPIEDFLFTYYSYRPGHLRRWHPGMGVQLADACSTERASWSYYRQVGTAVEVDTIAFAVKRDKTLRRTAEVLSATATRAPVFGCFGMHEWAMVYRLAASDLRHADWPLRLTVGEINDVVDDRQLSCTHFDAYRFFTDGARPLNLTPLRREDESANEQPGCLHAGMDLYRFAYKLTPLVPSELIADCFELARDIRYLDMQASPYDFADLGIEPVTVETATGRAEYAARQRAFAVRSAPLRTRISDIAQHALSHLEPR